MAKRKLSPAFDLTNLEGEALRLFPTVRGDFALHTSNQAGGRLSMSLNLRQVRQLARLLLEAAEARDGGGDG